MEIRLKFPNIPKILSRDEQTHFNAYVNIIQTIEIASAGMTETSILSITKPA